MESDNDSERVSRTKYAVSLRTLTGGSHARSIFKPK